MLRLHELLGEYEDRLRDVWARSVSCDTDASSGGADAVNEGFSAFLSELTSALRDAVSGGSSAPPGTLESDGGDSLSLDAVVATRAFGALHGCVLEVAAERGVEVSLAEHLALASLVNAAIARAAAGQRLQHDRDLHRIAHQLRNPLGSAIMALTLLRSRVDLGDSGRLADVAERNLRRLQGLIDEAVGEGSTP
jgi:signal transduction histidine kinase